MATAHKAEVLHKALDKDEEHSISFSFSFEKSDEHHKLLLFSSSGRGSCPEMSLPTVGAAAKSPKVLGQGNVAQRGTVMVT